MHDNNFCYPHSVIGAPFTEAITHWDPPLPPSPHPTVVPPAPIGYGYGVV